jgi:hypothetical protein
MTTPTHQEHKLADADEDALLQTWAAANTAGFQALNELIEREGLPLIKFRVMCRGE